MNHPTSAQCYEVARLLRTVAGEHPLNMIYPNVHEANICGTLLCHGGAYYSAKKIEYLYSHTYSNGADLMAKDLGFESKEELKSWAQENSNLWLNNYGVSMFCWEMSFANSKHPNGAESISDIADHWEMVGDKIKQTYES